jgi:hypothetical protein
MKVQSNHPSIRSHGTPPPQFSCGNQTPLVNYAQPRATFSPIWHLFLKLFSSCT